MSAQTDVFLPQDVILSKRNGERVSDENLRKFVAGIKDESVSDGQIAAFAMATFFQDMEPAEAGALTTAMRDSGDVINWTEHGFEAGAPIVDKHSTGGVGDKVSLMLAPIVAAAGAFVPMISGRGLGHTGGTLDKLDGIPGYDSVPDLDRFVEITRTTGCSIIGQTGELAPADKRFYSVRDVTATVESIPLITASILSKKLAAGLNSLVMDVKFGTGAFMQDVSKARKLARSIVSVAEAAGTPVTALLTDMNEVLGRTAGNNIEVIETLEFLEAPLDADKRLLDVTLALAAHMLALSGVAATSEAGEKLARDVLESGRAAEIFAQMVAGQGGPADLFEHRGTHLPLAAARCPVLAATSGYIYAMDTRRIGMAVVAMGGGRTDPAAKIDHTVGFGAIKGLGTYVEKGSPIAQVYARTDADAARAAGEYAGAVVISQDAPTVGPVVLEIITQADLER